MAKQELEIRVEETKLLVNDDRPMVWVGRNLDNDIIIDTEHVSRQHARIEYRQEQFWLQDSSNNGTFIYDSEGNQNYIRNGEAALPKEGQISFGLPREKTPTSDLVSFQTLTVQEPNPNYIEEKTEILQGLAPTQPPALLSPHLAYQFLQELVPDIFVLTTEEGFITYYNQALERAVLRNYRDFINKDFLSFIHPDDRQEFFTAMLEVQHQQQTIATVKARLCTLNPRWQTYEWQIQLPSPSLQALNLNGLVLRGYVGNTEPSHELLGHRYKIIRTLAGNTNCTTYLGVDFQRPTHPRCVIKQLNCMKHNPALLAISRRLFQAEATTLERLGKHDRIPLLLAYFEENDFFYLVQDFIEGDNLESILQKEKWSEEQATVFLRQLLAILAYVHKQGVIHRDISPRNIIRRSFDGNFVLIDFGSVKLFPNQVLAEAQPSKNPLTIVVGTPGYMASEQAMGQPVPSSDLYSLGLIVIEALAQRPFESMRTTWKEQLLDNGVTTDLIRILERMTAPVHERYDTALEIMLELNFFSPARSQIDSELSA